MNQSNNAIALRRGKIVLALGRLLPLLKWYISTSLYIPSDNKDRLIKQLESFYSDIIDAYRRARGILPYTPSVVKQMEKRKRDMKKKISGE